MTAVEEGTANPFTEGFFGKITQFVTGLTSESISTMGESFQQLFSYVSVYAAFGFISICVGFLGTFAFTFD